MSLTACRFGLALIFVWASPSALFPAQSDQQQVIEISLRRGKIHSVSAESSGGLPVVRVRQGRAVRLRWSSDAAVTLHLHGYDIEIHVPRDGTASMDLVARAAGRFAIERHERRGHGVLLYLEVLP